MHSEALSQETRRGLLWTEPFLSPPHHGNRRVHAIRLVRGDGAETVVYTHEKRVMAGRMRGLTTRAFNDPLKYTSKARSAFRASFADQVDPEGILPEDERESRATALYRAHMTALAMRSSQVRASKAQQVSP